MRRRGSAGFSLTEMMVSLSVLAATLSCFMSASSAADRIFYHERYMTQAIAIGEGVTEGLLLLDASDAALFEGSHPRTFDRNGLDVDEDEAFYTARWVVSSYEEVPGVRRIDLTVRWMELGDVREIGWTTYRD